jgi:hypothetical protein
MVFPTVPVLKESDLYYRFLRRAWIRRSVGVIRPGDPAPEAGFKVTTDSYAAEEYGVRTKLPWRIRDNSDEPLRLPANKTEFVTDQIVLDAEYRVAQLVETTSWDSATAIGAGDRWDEGGEVLALVDAKKIAIRKACGFNPNVAVIGAEVWPALNRHPQLLRSFEQIKMTGEVMQGEGDGGDHPGILRVGTVAGLLGIRRLLIGEMVYDVEEEDAGDADADSDVAFIWGKYFWLGYVNPSPSLDMPSAGYRFVSRRDGFDRTIRQYDQNDIKSTWYEGSEIVDEKVVSTACGGILTTVVN